MALNGKNELDQREGGPEIEPIDQVRELLFGAAARETSEQIRVLENRVEEMRADFLARIGALEDRVIALARDSETRHDAAIDAIGGAIAQLGATIENMRTRRKGD